MSNLRKIEFLSETEEFLGLNDLINRNSAIKYVGALQYVITLQDCEHFKQVDIKYKHLDDAAP